MFVSSNIQGQTEIAPMLIVSKLEQNSYAEASAIALVLLAMSFATLAVINLLGAGAGDMSNVATIASSHAVSVAGRESALFAVC